MTTMLVKNTLRSLRMRPDIVSGIRSLSTNHNSAVFSSASYNTPLQLTNSHKHNLLQHSLIFERHSRRVQIDDLLPQFNPIEELKCPTKNLDEPLQAIKRTYQPSVLRRKRKHGFRTRRVSISGRKVLKRRFNKGRWRMSL